MPDITLWPERTFRQTEGVHFADISVPGSNGLDLVEHQSCSVSPPDVDGVKRWYRHTHQVDYNRCIKGHRLFELFWYGFRTPHWFVLLGPDTGALKIPAGCYHRSYSGVDGSLLLNHAVRDPEYDENEEFYPQEVPGVDLDTAPIGYFDITAREAGKFIQEGTL